jgi:murein L,D-transpeptidase YafK
MLSQIRVAVNPFRTKRFWFLFIVVSLFVHGHSQASSPSEGKTADGLLIPACLIGLDWEKGPAYAIVVEKASQTLRVYEWNNGFTLKDQLPCSTGEAAGKKEKAGDSKTPEGVYFFTKAFEKRYLSATYGNGAFVMDYPNLLDRQENRKGHNIWLHGTNKRLKPRDSNGCVAVENGNIDILARYIRLNRTPIIVRKKLHMVTPDNLAADRKKLAALLKGWKKAFISGDQDAYNSYYIEPLQDKKQLWESWNPVRESWENAGMPFHMTMKDVTVARGNPCVVALFDQHLELGPHVMKVGTKKVFWEPHGDTWKIVGEEYQPGTFDGQDGQPMTMAVLRLDRLRKDFKTVAELIAEWADAWSAKDIDRYRACYADDFYNRRMGLKSWIRYKEKLNKRYNWIKVAVEDLEISQNSDRSTATFLQKYRSSGNNSVGVKRLRLKRVGGLWKIYRETWQKI